MPERVGAFTATQYIVGRSSEATFSAAFEKHKAIIRYLRRLDPNRRKSPLDFARSNLVQSGQISRNALSLCGLKKRYKRCSGKD